jgi:hypothetical protein
MTPMAGNWRVLQSLFPEHAKLAGIADVALLKRLRNAGEWLRQLWLLLLRESDIHLAPSVLPGFAEPGV